MEFTVPSASNMADRERSDSTEITVKASSIFAVTVARDSSHQAIPFVWPGKWNDATLPLREVSQHTDSDTDLSIITGMRTGPTGRSAFMPMLLPLLVIIIRSVCVFWLFEKSRTSVIMRELHAFCCICLSVQVFENADETMGGFFFPV